MHLPLLPQRYVVRPYRQASPAQSCRDRHMLLQALQARAKLSFTWGVYEDSPRLRLALLWPLASLQHEKLHR